MCVCVNVWILIDRWVSVLCRVLHFSYHLECELSKYIRGEKHFSTSKSKESIDKIYNMFFLCLCCWFVLFYYVNLKSIIIHYSNFIIIIIWYRTFSEIGTQFIIGALCKSYTHTLTHRTDWIFLLLLKLQIISIGSSDYHSWFTFCLEFGLVYLCIERILLISFSFSW